jgi:hypothetical protein
MNKGMLLVFFPVLFFANNLLSQNSGIYVPPQFQKIYNGNTRAWDGNPGEGYWQNHSDYFLKVNFDPESRLVSGEGKIIYYNDSPDTLKKIVFRLYQDIYKKGIARDWGWGEADLHDGTNIERLNINGYELNPDTLAGRTATNWNIKLPEALAPGSHIKIEIAWNFILPATRPIRMGSYREGGNFIAYWYPQISVYDDVDGWDLTEYTGSVEFYNDFNNYDVEITVPENFLVRATGEMLNAEEILTKNIYNRYTNALESDDVVRIITPDDLAEESITKSGSHTWKYKAVNIPDFTFACVKDYLWDGVSSVADNKTGRRTFADVIYKEEDINFEQAAHYSRLSVESLSNDLPGIPFPYSHITSFCNGNSNGGMESPMMTNDGAPQSKTRLLGLLHHEITHTYFPFYMGINERKYGWMDEGWASFLPQKLFNKIFPDTNFYRYPFGRYLPVMGKEYDIPLMVPSKFVKGFPLTAAIYGRAFFAYTVLENLLGTELFKKAIQEFIIRWNGKHPLPYDFFFTFNDVAGEDLSWIWNPWFYEFGYCDLGLEQNKDGKYIVKLIGNQPVSVEVVVKYQDGSEKLIKENPAIWRNGNTEFILKIDQDKKIRSIKIENAKIPDFNPDNNLLVVN